LASVSLALTGSGGSGVMTAGRILFEAAAEAGWYALMGKSFGPQIRGGEAAALLRFADHPVQNPDDAYDVLVALDWANILRFASEIPLGADSVVLADPDQGDVPDVIAGVDPLVRNVSFGAIAKGQKGGRANMVAVGAVARAIGLPDRTMVDCVRRILGGKGAQLVDVALASMEAGQALAPELNGLPRLGEPPHNANTRWRISGNEATGLGALHGGVRFVAAYPITPATDVLEWLAPNLPKLGGALLQAEDELAAANMCLGASFGGVPALTATSGPGLSLMTETLGLAVASETPMVVVDVMRGGPSTGIPTKSEQTDLNIAVYGLHGDAPHLVLAPNGIDDCLPTTQWAVGLAEATQAPAIVLTDQAMGQSSAVVDAPESAAIALPRLAAAEPGEGYRRYALTESGVSPVAVPGTPGGAYTGDGLEHDETGTPSSRPADHVAQLDKRLRKLAAFEYGERWADVEGDGPVAVVTWGSATQAVREALGRLASDAVAVRLISVRLIHPASPEAMAEALAGVERVLVVEQNHDGQFYRYLRAHYDLDCPMEAFHHPGPLPLRPGEVVSRVRDFAVSTMPSMTAEEK
jgi:2-oxoglutarate ferredoxin oxidoreductase subunit alpha